MTDNEKDPFAEIDIEQEALLLLSAQSSALKELDSSRPFRYVGTNERIKLILIVIAAVFVIPFAWSQAYTVVHQIVLAIFAFLISASEAVLALLGGGLLLYPLVLALLVSLAWPRLYNLLQANKVELCPDGMLVRWPFRLEKKIPWAEITSVFLIRPAGTLLPQRWLIGLGTSMTHPLSIRLPSAAAVGVPLIEQLKIHCPWASIEEEVIEAFEPALAEDSHTQLWLKWLNRAPKEEDLMPLLPGALLKQGRYLILTRIGVGGQGTAYLARDKPLDREIVVKENLFPVFVDPAVRAAAEQRFRQEVELLEHLNHDHIVSLLDSFLEDHRGYLVLDYIDGLTLRQLVNRHGPLPEADVKALLLQMCVILSYLHGLTPPVVHRDFTPENLMLDKNAQLILIDFNVARPLESTRTATVVGKHAYIPPEQFRGESDTRSDIYALGATLHFLLTGCDPEPISTSFPAKVNEKVSAAMNALVAKATALDTQERYQTAGEIPPEIVENTVPEGDN